MIHDDDDEAIEDRDMPSAEDMDAEDDNGTFPCIYCGKPIYEDSEWCPHCGKYLSREDARFNTPLWVGIMIVIFLVMMGMAFWR